MHFAKLSANTSARRPATMFSNRRWRSRARLSLPEVSDQLFRKFEELAPFGRMNPEPVFLFESITYTRPAQLFGKNHVKLFVRGEQGEIEAVGFGLGQHDWSKAPARLAGTLDWDDYRNRVQLRIADWHVD